MRSLPIVNTNSKQLDWIRALSYLILGMGVLASVLPFVFMVLSGFKDSGELQRIPPTFLPDQWILDNFIWAWDVLNFPRLFLNSIFVTTTITISVIYTSGLLGYVLEKFRFPGDKSFSSSLSLLCLCPTKSRWWFCGGCSMMWPYSTIT